MSTTFTLMRLYMKMQSMPRLPIPHIGNAGILYSSSLMDRHRHAYKGDRLRVNGNPEFAATGGLFIRPGAQGCYMFGRGYSTSASVEDVKKAEKERLEKKKFKLMTAETIKVMVVSETGSLSTMTLQDANALAKKKRLDLVHIVNDRDKPVRTEKEVYKLVSKLADFEAEEGAQEGESTAKSKAKKSEKTLILKSTIGEHDANSKINMMLKWVEKGHRTRVMIGQAGEKGNAEDVFKMIESKITEVEGQIQQKILKGNEIRFYIAPPKAKPPTKNKPVKSKNNVDKLTENAYSDSESESDEPKNKKQNKKTG